MDIEGKSALVLGGCDLVGSAVCRELLLQQPAVLSVASRRREKVEPAVRQLQAEFPLSSEQFAQIIRASCQ